MQFIICNYQETFSEKILALWSCKWNGDISCWHKLLHVACETLHCNNLHGLNVIYTLISYWAMRQESARTFATLSKWSPISRYIKNIFVYFQFTKIPCKITVKSSFCEILRAEKNNLFQAASNKAQGKSCQSRTSNALFIAVWTCYLLENQKNRSILSRQILCPVHHHCFWEAYCKMWLQLCDRSTELHWEPDTRMTFWIRLKRDLFHLCV